MRLLLACIVLVGLAASVSAQRAAAALTYKSCTASGDPHFVTFDGCLHDFQAVDGVYNFASHLSPISGASFDVQSRITTCGTAIIAGLRVSCIRHTTWRAALTGLGETVCRWGYWNGVYENVACTHKNNVTGTTTSLSLPVGSWIPTANPKWREFGFYNFTRSTSGFLTATPLNDFVGNFPIVSTAAHAIEVRSPSTVDNQVAGLCGVPNGIASDDYSYFADSTRALTNVVPSATKSRIYNTFAIMNAWGLGNAVQPDGSSVVKPFGYAHLHEQGHVFEAADVPAPVLPTSDEQKAVQALTVTDLGKLVDIEKTCSAQFGDNRAGFDSCVYDMSSVTDPVVIASNAAVVAQASTPTDSSSSSSTTLNTDAIVGLSVGLGIFAVIAVAVAAILYTRLKKANEGYSKALIELHRKNGPTGSSSDRQMDDMTIPLGENL